MTTPRYTQLPDMLPEVRMLRPISRCLVALVALATALACGGGGGSPTPSSSPPSTTTPSGGFEITIDGGSAWPPSGTGCEALVTCCTDATAVDSSVDLFCKLTVIATPDCGEARKGVAQYVTELGKTPPASCR